VKVQAHVLELLEHVQVLLVQSQGTDLQQQDQDRHQLDLDRLRYVQVVHVLQEVTPHQVEAAEATPHLVEVVEEVILRLAEAVAAEAVEV